MHQITGSDLEQPCSQARPDRPPQSAPDRSPLPYSQTPSLGHIDSNQVVVLLLYLTASTAFLAFPALVMTRAGSAGWLSMALSAGLGYIALWGWIRWSETTASKGFVPALRETLGRFFGDFVGFLVFSYLLSSTGLLARVFSGGTIIGLLPEVPIEILQGTLIVVSAFGAWLGLEPVARTGVVLAPVVTVSLSVVLLASYRLVDFRHVFPLWGLGPLPVLKQGLRGAGIFANVSALVILKAYMRNPRLLRAAGMWGMSLGAFFMVITTLVVAAAFPYPESTRQLFPLGVLARSIMLGKFLQRLEALFSFSWFFSIAVNLAIAYVLSLIVFSQLSDSQTVRPYVFPVSSFTFGLGLLPPSLVHAVSWLDAIYSWAGNSVLWLGWALYFISRVRYGNRSGRTGTGGDTVRRREGNGPGDRANRSKGVVPGGATGGDGS
ncbi:MAG: GerAB/ArcD/ProY family transporter [Firmicutes bacterium]|nr:GerAB/ArcD/ProY family transporter [Candidatus Fermentithermobacillaceae bacterium]